MTAVQDSRVMLRKVRREGGLCDMVLTKRVQRSALRKYWFAGWRGGEAGTMLGSVGDDDGVVVCEERGIMSVA